MEIGRASAIRRHASAETVELTWGADPRQLNLGAAAAAGRTASDSNCLSPTWNKTTLFSLPRPLTAESKSRRLHGPAENKTREPDRGPLEPQHHIASPIDHGVIEIRPLELDDAASPPRAEGILEEPERGTATPWTRERRRPATLGGGPEGRERHSI